MTFYFITIQSKVEQNRGCLQPVASQPVSDSYWSKVVVHSASCFFGGTINKYLVKCSHLMTVVNSSFIALRVKGSNAASNVRRWVTKRKFTGGGGGGGAMGGGEGKRGRNAYFDKILILILPQTFPT